MKLYATVVSDYDAMMELVKVKADPVRFARGTLTAVKRFRDGVDGKLVNLVETELESMSSEAREYIPG